MSASDVNRADRAAGMNRMDCKGLQERRAQTRAPGKPP